MAAFAGQVIGKANARAEVQVVVLGNAADVGIGDGAVDRAQIQVGAAVLDVGPANHVVILVPAETQAQRQAAGRLPVILRIEAKLLGGHNEVGVAVGNIHPYDGAGSLKSLRLGCGIAKNGARIRGEVD